MGEKKMNKKSFPKEVTFTWDPKDESNLLIKRDRKESILGTQWEETQCENIQIRES